MPDLFSPEQVEYAGHNISVMDFRCFTFSAFFTAAGAAHADEYQNDAYDHKNDKSSFHVFVPLKQV